MFRVVWLFVIRAGDIDNFGIIKCGIVIRQLFFLLRLRQPAGGPARRFLRRQLLRFLFRQLLRQLLRLFLPRRVALGRLSQFLGGLQHQRLRYFRTSVRLLGPQHAR